MSSDVFKIGNQKIDKFQIKSYGQYMWEKLCQYLNKN